MLLELGGNDAAVLLDDQPITEALCAELATSAFIGTGQMCINIKRIYAPAARVAELADGIASVLNDYVIGDGMYPRTTIGPLTTDAQFKRVRGLVESAADAGGTVRQCGTISADEKAGYFLRPAVVTGLDESHPLVAEEQFGPALPSRDMRRWTKPSTTRTRRTSGSPHRCGRRSRSGREGGPAPAGRRLIHQCAQHLLWSTWWPLTGESR